MAGFGQGPFGNTKFGHFPWSRSVLFDLLPSLHKSQDAAIPGQPLETFTESLRYSYDVLLNRIGNWTSLRDPLTVRTQYNETATVRLGAIRNPETPIEQRGVDGAIAANRSFSSATARFRATDIGKSLILSNSAIPINNREFKIAALVNSMTVICDPPLVVDPGPLNWQLKARPVLDPGLMVLEMRGGDVSQVAPGWTLFDGASEFEIYARNQFFPVTAQTKILTEREGNRGEALSNGKFQAEVDFTQQDVGKPFTISGSTAELNNDKFQIYFVDPATPSIIQLHAPLTIEGADANGGVTYTLQVGAGHVRVRHLQEGLNTPLSVVVNDNDITVNLQTNPSGVTVSTATQVAAAITASTSASVLVTASATGTGASLAGVVDYTSIPGVRLSQDAGPLTWALLPFPRLEIYAASPPIGIVEQEGVDLQTVAPSTIISTVAKFTASDVGKRIVMRGSSLGQDGFYTIASVVSLTQATVTAATLVNESNLTWELRTLSMFGDLTEAQCFAPSMIQYLAQDFGIEIDSHETEARQRSWVENVSQWIDLKGLEKAYKITGLISGFNVTVSPLYRITTAIAAALPTTDVYNVGETGLGRFGSDGQLAIIAGNVGLVSATAAFKASDVGVSIIVQNCANPINENKIFTIASVTDPNTVQFLATDTATTPDYGVGGTAQAPTIKWDLVRLYTDLAPTRPVFDDVNPELMQYIVGTNNFLVDQYCWDANFVNYFDVSISAVTPSSSNGVPISFTLTVDGVTLSGPIYTNCGVIGALGRWTITDSANQVFYVESLPVEIAPGPPPTHTFNVFSSVVPALGAATLTYNCEPQDSCSYCDASKVLIILDEGTILNEHGIHVERVLERVLTREQNEVKPIHVELVPIFRRTLQASLTLSASMITDIEIYSVMIAPLTEYFDIIAGDIIRTDI